MKYVTGFHLLDWGNWVHLINELGSTFPSTLMGLGSTFFIRQFHQLSLIGQILLGANLSSQEPPVLVVEF